MQHLLCFHCLFLRNIPINVWRFYVLQDLILFGNYFEDTLKTKGFVDGKIQKIFVLYVYFLEETEFRLRLV